MANFMQASVSLPELQYFKLLNSIYLNIYNCVWKVGFLKSRYIIVYGRWVFSNPDTYQDTWSCVSSQESRVADKCVIHKNC